MDKLKSSKLIKILSWGTGIIFILLPFHALLTTWAGSNFGQLDLFRIWKELLLIPLTAGAVWLVARDKNLKQWLKTNSIVRLIGLYILLHIAIGIYALATGNVNEEALAYSWIINLRFLVFFLVCIILAAKSPWLKRNWRKLVIWPALAIILFGLLQQFVLPVNFLSHFGYGHETIPAYHTVDQKSDYVRLQSTLRGPNPLGAYLVLIITTLMSFFIARKNKRLQRSVLAVAAIVVLFYSYSRSAWLGLALAGSLLIYKLVQSQKTRRLIFGLSIGAVIVASGGLALLGRNSIIDNTLFHTDKTSRSPDSSNEVHTQAFTSGLKSVVKQPLGRGPGTAGPASFRNDKPPRLAENYYLQIAQEAGIIGLAIFLAINFKIAKLLWQSGKQPLSIILFSSFMGLFLVNMLSHAWADDTLSLLWWGLAGIALSSVILKPKQHFALFHNPITYYSKAEMKLGRQKANVETKVHT